MVKVNHNSIAHYFSYSSYQACITALVAIEERIEFATAMIFRPHIQFLQPFILSIRYIGGGRFFASVTVSSWSQNCNAICRMANRSVSRRAFSSSFLISCLIQSCAIKRKWQKRRSYYLRLSLFSLWIWFHSILLFCNDCWTIYCIVLFIDDVIDDAVCMHKIRLKCSSY